MELDDEREALAELLMSDAVMFSDALGRGYAYIEADAILAAGFRRQGPITDAQVEALWTFLTDLAEDTRVFDKHEIRAALEATFHTSEES